MDNATIQKINEVVGKNDAVAIAVGKNPTIDDMGAALALYLSLRDLQKQVSIASPTEPIVEVSSLVGIDKVEQSFDATGGDLIVSFPYKEGEIEKVSYTLEDGYLNIVVKAQDGTLSFGEKDVLFRRGGSGSVKLLFIIGTPRLSDLGNLFNAEEMKETTIVNIDNKSDNQGFGDLVFVSQKYSSVSEQVASLLSELDYPLDVDIAQNLLSGIAYATRNFQSPKTSVVAFEMAASLMKKGAVRPRDAERVGGFEDQAFFDPFAKAPRQGSQQGRDTRDRFGQGQRPQQQRGQRPQQPQKLQQKSPPQQPQKKDEEDEEAPPDWLTPKVYKGSTLV